MPLLKRKAFEKSTASEYLRDDDEVFHCEITDEIFKDYEEYCERIILVNSMVWTCEMTGKNNLTYSEALESEKAARKSLKDFPMELRTPILYLASKTNRCSFAEMAEDVFNFVRDRYFVGETVEACLEGDSWREAHILSVSAQKQPPGSKATLPSSSYFYEVEQFSDSAEGQMGTTSSDRVRRKKGIFSRDKCRLFLKQFVELDSGIVGIKKSAKEKYNISKVNFDQIFTGSPPEFPSSKKLIKNSMSPPASRGLLKPGSANKLNNKSAKKNVPDKKGRQESMDKFLKKTDKNEVQKIKTDPANKKSAQDLVEKMRRAEELMKQRREEEKAKKKEKNAKLQAYLKEWQKVKDDLQLEDHKVIPTGTTLYLEGISHEDVGDFLSVLEFVHLFADTMKTKDVFHNGLDVETLRKALVSQEHAGLFSDLVQMMMTTIFSLQEDEAEEYNEGGGIDDSNGNEDRDEEVNGEMGTTKAVELATKACKWSQTYLGTPLSKLPLDPTTISEVVRLHLLSSGAGGGTRCATWRYQQRGGYSGADDAGLRLRRQRPQLLRDLRARHLAELDIKDKFQILQCLQNQIISYATVRDIIEERLENYKTMKHELRTLQIQERRREIELVANKSKIKKEAAAKKEEQKLTGDKAKALEQETAALLEKLVKEGEDKKKEFLKKSQQMQADCFEFVSYLGSDRAYRRYYLHQTVGGVFVEAGAESRGACLERLVVPTVAATVVDPLTYVTQLFEKGGSDKENDSAANSRGNSPKKPLTQLNGLSHKLNGLDSDMKHMKELLVCTGDINSCYVHGLADYRPQWWVYHTQEQVEDLILSLNKRGVREAELKNALENDKANILEYIKKCPISMLNPAAFPPPTTPHSTRLRKSAPSLTVAADSSVTETLELALRDYVLELEEKIFHGCLGAVQVKDREAWRGTIMLRGYDKQADYLTWGPNKQYRDDHPTDIANKNVEDKDKSELRRPRDPDHALTTSARPSSPPAVRQLASALLQIAQGVHHKYLKRPLGLDDKERKEREAKNKPLDLEALARWEISLMECQSYSQVFLHLFTLDSSVTWSASILNASCKICRRKTDPDNMLLCDNCNKGHHLYCLKPKLTKVPSGDWFCAQCKPKEQKSPRKKRKLFSDEDMEEDVEEDERASSSVHDGVCCECGSGGQLEATCVRCATRAHRECVVGSVRRWVCAGCSCRDSDDSEDNTALVKLKVKRSRKSKESSPVVNGHATKKSRRSKEEVNTSRKSRGSTNGTPVTNGVNERRTRRGSPALHAAEMELLVRDVMRHKDSWPFYEPVSLSDVPDYLEIIEDPMDFMSIKQKLESGEYASDEQLISDATKVFINCYTYNQDTHPVAKAGVRLEKYFNKRCTELGLPTLPDINLEPEKEDTSDDEPLKAKRPLNGDLPNAKRPKHK